LAYGASGTVDFNEQFEKFCWDILLALKIPKNGGFSNHFPPSSNLAHSLAGKFVNFQMNSCEYVSKLI